MLLSLYTITIHIAIKYHFEPFLKLKARVFVIKVIIDITPILSSTALMLMLNSEK